MAWGDWRLMTRRESRAFATAALVQRGWHAKSNLSVIPEVRGHLLLTAGHPCMKDTRDGRAGTGFACYAWDPARVVRASFAACHGVPPRPRSP